MNTVRSSSTMYRPPNKVSPFAQWIVRFSVAMLLVGCLSIAIAQHSSVYAQETISHTVRSGETLSRIASRYGVSVNALANYNGISNPNLLRPGQVLRIPMANRTAQANPPAQTIPRPQSTPMPSAPVSPRPATVSPSQPLAPAGYPSPTIYPSPTPTPPVASTRYYTVRQNDTLYGIAARYGVSVEAIKARNRINGSTIYVGQLLAIP